jgi:HPt (histidine-containing phosphotransfer) domain-containing protein
LKVSACAELPRYLGCESNSHVFQLRRIDVIQSTASQVYDHQRSLARMGQDLGLFRVMVDYLAKDGPRWLQDIRIALPTEDILRVQQRAHSLTGLISNFGSGRAWRAAARLEDLARAGKREDFTKSFAELELALEELLNALKPYMAAENSI